MEFEQPAIIAEALAETAVHRNSMNKLMKNAEEAASANPSEKSALLIDLIHEVRESKTGGGRGRPTLADLSARFTVKPDELDEKLMEVYGVSGTR